MRKLTSMVDFVLSENVTSQLEYFDCYKLIRKYANFLKQPLELWMFVACKLVDGVWVGFEEPNIESFKYDVDISFGETEIDFNFYESDLKEYQQAKERCLFTGFELDLSKCKEFKYQSDIISINIDDKKLIEYNCYYKTFILFVNNERDYNGIETIEDLLNDDFEYMLTPTALKELGL